MKLHRFIIEDDFSKDSFSFADTKLIHQLYAVLHLKAGEECIVSDGSRNEARCRITAISQSACVCDVIDRSYNTNENEVYGALYCSLLKKENFEVVAQKVTEAGVCEIIPIVSRRTVKFSAPPMERLRAIIKEAAEQSGRGVIPTLCDAIPFDEAIRRASDSHSMTFFYHMEGIPFAEWKKQNIAPKKANIFIGPEGGWDEYELNEARKNNFSVISLGKTIFRAETAAIIGSYLAIH